ncbi:hypothetical protein PhCBS80983_g05319 [Powellomyces hirtus]|uniref:ABC transporter domain-containing protein n=1 Tax=Powellomyces hirtus TaxID=109895 RepID=A0A507DUN5_9FUNG|nr:hypothetical protein PhCBS80983_g05319 [Powellomyces hirtus]
MSAGECIIPGAVGLPLQETSTCLPHFLCPNSTDPSKIPYFCPPTQECLLDRLLGTTCEGAYEPVVCPEGYYCPDQFTKAICPAGSYCPTGSVTPVKCEAMSSCPEGVGSPGYYGGFVICLIIDLFLGAIVFYLKRLERRKSRGTLFPKKATLEMTQNNKTVIPEKGGEIEMRADSVPDDVETGSFVLPNEASALPGTEISPIPSERASLLVNAFSRASGGGHMKMEFKFEDLGLRLKNGRPILAGVNGMIHAGHLTAIMGPSGAGKTTFMNVLMGKVPRTDGTLFINGLESEMSKFKKIIGYVPQEDVMLRELTVRENILHAARVKLPSAWTNKEIEDYTEAVIASLGLSHVAHSIIGDETTRGVSGGQRKRVNIGMELAGVPLTLFLDEPTSGLDSTSALSVCENLKEVARLGLTVVSVIHQPRYEIFRSFDDIVLLVPGGQTAYIGPTEAAQAYFEDMGFQFDPRANAADLLMDILAGSGVNHRSNMTPADLVAAWEKRARQSEALTETKTLGGHDDFHNKVPQLIREKGSWWYKQLWYCHNRALIQHYRNLSSFILEIFVGCFAGAMIGIATGGNQMFSGVYVVPYTLLSPSPVSWFVPLLGLLVGIIVSLAGAPAGVKVFSEERTVYWREAASGHNRFAYYVGKTVAAAYRFIISSLHFTATYVFLAKPQSDFATQFLTMMLLFYGVYGMAALVSMITSRQNANLMAVIVCLFASIFCGFGPSIKDAKSWGIIFIWQLSYNRWAAEVLFTEYLIPFRGVYDIDAVAESTGYTLDRVGYDIGMIVLLGAVWRVLAFFCMILLNRDKQK